MWRRTIKDSIGGDTIDMVPLVQHQQKNSMERPCYHHMCNSTQSGLTNPEKELVQHQQLNSMERPCCHHMCNNTQSGSTINPEVELNNCDGP